MGKNYYPVNNETVIFQGRTFEQEGIRCFSWTDSGFTFNFEGTDVFGRRFGQTSLTAKCHAHTWVCCWMGIPSPKKCMFFR